MINAKRFLDELKKENLDYFSGVPDSTFKELITEITEDQVIHHRIASNECEAISLSAGYNLATGKIGVTYMQNAGLGKIVNPLTSLLSREVYSIPTLLFIGHRGKPGEKDEPQHKMMGRITTKLLEDLEIKHEILPKNLNDALNTIKRMKNLAEKEKYATAIIIEKDTFENIEKKKNKKENDLLSREETIKIILENIAPCSKIISTTGKTSRELFEQRILRKENPSDFLTVGSMGCSSSIAAEISIQKKKKEVYCLDGDGAAIMQLGNFTTIGSLSPENFTHILLDNNSYESTGGQKTNSNNIDFEKIALACGYKHSKTVSRKEEIINQLNNLQKKKGPKLLVIKARKGSRNDLGRPNKTPLENKLDFIDSLK